MDLKSWWLIQRAVFLWSRRPDEVSELLETARERCLVRRNVPGILTTSRLLTQLALRRKEPDRARAYLQPALAYPDLAMLRTLATLEAEEARRWVAASEKEKALEHFAESIAALRLARAIAPNDSESAACVQRLAEVVAEMGAVRG